MRVQRSNAMRVGVIAFAPVHVERRSREILARSFNRLGRLIGIFGRVISYFGEETAEKLGGVDGSPDPKLVYPLAREPVSREPVK